MYGAEHWILQNVIRYTGNFMKYGAVEKWVDFARNKGLYRSNEERNIPQTLKSGKANWIGCIWIRKCLLKQFIAGKIQGQVD